MHRRLDYLTFFPCRLLNWAADIEQQISVQRQELRQAKIELVAAQEVSSCPDCHAAAMHKFELSTAQEVNACSKYLDGTCPGLGAWVAEVKRQLCPTTLSDNPAHLLPLLD